MNFLELCKAVRSRVGLQGSGPASVTSATTAELDIINSVSDAWIDIQNFRREWRWMRGTQTFSLVVGTTDYELSDIFSPGYLFKNWRKDSCYAYINGKYTLLRYIDYDNFIYIHKNDTENSVVHSFSVRPWDHALIFNSPADTYSITIDYQKAPQVLEANTDTPSMDSYFHLLIVYSAVEKYSVIINSPSIFSQYSQQYVTMLGQLMRDQLGKKSEMIRGIA